MKSNFKAIQRHLKYLSVWDKNLGAAPRKMKLPKVRIEWYPESKMYVCYSEYSQRHVPKNAGFTWNSFGKYWYTRNPEIANNLIDRADRTTRERIKEALSEGEIVSVE